MSAQLTNQSSPRATSVGSDQKPFFSIEYSKILKPLLTRCQLKIGRPFESRLTLGALVPEPAGEIIGETTGSAHPELREKNIK